MDALTFGANTLIRKLDPKSPVISQIKLKPILDKLEINMDQFIDMSILCGCDYCSKISGIGPINALKLIKDHKSIEGVLSYINSTEKLKEKHIYDTSFKYKEARNLFLNPNVLPADKININFVKPKINELKAFLCEEKQFEERRFLKIIKRLEKVNI